jgi:Asp-tRNA(Asn)/Glu-tRNA(Gln) amidotransferase A subunit family amidase
MDGPSPTSTCSPKSTVSECATLLPLLSAGCASPSAVPRTGRRPNRQCGLLTDAGTTVTALELPDSFSALTAAHKVILFSEGRAAFLNLYRAHLSLLHDDFQHRVENRDGFTDQDLIGAYDLAARCRAEFDAIASNFDAVITPSAPGEAPFGIGAGNPALNQIWTLLHVPCIGLPAMTGPAGMPLGLTITGPRFSDRRLLACAKRLDDVFMAAG